MARSSSSAVKKSPAKMQEGSKRKFEAEAGPSMSPSSPAESSRRHKKKKQKRNAEAISTPPAATTSTALAAEEEPVVKAFPQPGASSAAKARAHDQAVKEGEQAIDNALKAEGDAQKAMNRKEAKKAKRNKKKQEKMRAQQDPEGKTEGISAKGPEGMLDDNVVEEGSNEDGRDIFHLASGLDSVDPSQTRSQNSQASEKAQAGPAFHAPAEVSHISASDAIDPAAADAPVNDLYAQYMAIGASSAKDEHTSTPSPKKSQRSHVLKLASSSNSTVDPGNLAAQARVLKLKEEKEARKAEAQQAVLERSIQQAKADARREAQEEMEGEMEAMRRRIRELEERVEKEERVVGEQLEELKRGREAADKHESTMEQLREAAGCGVCFETLNDPHILSCGHIACKSCLTSWFRTAGAYLHPPMEPIPEDQDLSYFTKVCHVCRSCILERPARVYFAKDILEPLGIDPHIPNASPTDRAKRDSRSPRAQAAAAKKAKVTKDEDPWAGMFPPESDEYKLWDESDQIHRCNGCCAEVADGTCEGCGREFSISDPDEYNEIYGDGEFGFGDEDEESGEEDEEREGEHDEAREARRAARRRRREDARQGLFGLPREPIVVMDEEEDDEGDEAADDDSINDFIVNDQPDRRRGDRGGDRDERDRSDEDDDVKEDWEGDGDTLSNASNDSSALNDAHPPSEAYLEAMQIAREGRADRHRQRREQRSMSSRVERDDRPGNRYGNDRGMRPGLMSMIDDMADESDADELTDEDEVHEDDRVGLRGDYPGLSDLGDNLESESDRDDRTEEEYEDSFIDDDEEEEEEDEEEEMTEEEDPEERVGYQRRLAKSKREAEREKSEDSVQELEETDQEEEESDAPSIGEMRRRRLKALGDKSGVDKEEEEQPAAPRRPNRSGSRRIIVSDDEDGLGESA